MTEGTAGVLSWYSVPTVYLASGFKRNLYEKRITVRRASSMTEAMERAAAEAREYEGERDVDGR